MKYIITIALLLCFGCTDSGKVTKVLKGAGYTDIEITGYGFFECSKDDTVKTTFNATGPNGDKISGTVCCGLIFKGCTIRF